uniref:CSON012824 protein n=1 Tax=Culicoides sonorensis TaxID=179676 RepID=A0A336KKQ0_CULSO
MRGHTGYFLASFIGVSLLLVLLQIAFQIVLAVIGSDFLAHCEFLEKLFRHLGFIKLSGVPWQQWILWLYPEVLAFIASVCFYCALHNLVIGHLPPLEEGEERPPLSERPDYDAGPSPEQLKICLNIGKITSIVFLLFAAVFHPSAINGIYFLVFLGAATWWSCAKELERGFGIVLRCTMAVFIIHIFTFMVYQTPWPQEFLDKNSTVARVLGFTPLIYSECNDTALPANLTSMSLELSDTTFSDLDTNFTSTTPTPVIVDPVNDIRVIQFAKYNADYYLNPVFLILCYYTIALTSSLLLTPKSEEKKRGFSQLENGTTPPVSFRMGRNNILRKTLTGQRWKGAARKVKQSCEIYVRNHENVEKHQHEVEEPPNERTPVQFLMFYESTLMRGGTRKIRDIKTISQEVPGTSSSGDVIQMEEMGTSETKGTETVPDEDKTTFGEQFLSGLNNVLSFIYQNSYIFTNVVMMSWSIVYHSWFGFVYLIWSNLIWILPKQRMNMLRSSPFLVLYAEFLLLINYIYGMDLYEDELPSWVKTQGISLEQIGIIRFREYPCRSLILKSMFTGMFWITLRQMIQEKKAERKSSTLADMVAPLTVTVSPATSALSRRPEPKSSEFVTKLGNIINSFLVKGWIWVVAITLFIFGISGGDNMTMFRIIYMALFLFFVITFQLSLDMWRKILYGFWLAVIIYSMAILILVYTYQFDRFDEHWENITHISKELQHDIGLEKYETKQLFLHLLTPTLIVIITVIQLHYCHKKFLVISEIPTHASPETEREEGQESDSNSIYGGIEEDEEEKILSRQASKRIRLIEKIKNRTLTRRDLQKALNLLWKRILYLSEYVWVFLEIHFLKIIMVFAFYLATNHVRFLHILFATVAALGVGCRSQNQILTSKIASLFCSILLILTMIYQIKYIKEEDYAYNCHPNATMPNETLPETRTVLNNTAIWFGFIKSNKKTPLLTLITPYLAYIVLVTVHSVVTLRQTIRRIRLGQPVQTAKLLFPKIVRKDADKDIPHLLMYLCNYGFYKFGIEISLVMLTFVIGRRMDIYALIYAFWLCGLFVLDRTKLSNIWGSLRWFLVGSIITQYLTFVGLPPRLCIAGTNRVNLFSIGYLVGSFTFLWQGTDFYLRPIRLILKWWNMLIGYTVFVISLKAMLQIAGCFYIKDLMKGYCWLVQLLGISCICYPKAIDETDLEKCSMEMEDVKLLWDGVCFTFLIIQKRLFSSHYFCHIINETKASTILASRGAELIEELRAKEMKLEQEREMEVLEKLKAKMDRIKATQQKLLESAKEPAHHAKGYHTPIEDDVATSVLIEGDEDDDDEDENGSDLLMLDPRMSQRGSLLQPQVHSPQSALMTASLEAYMDPQRFSFSSPPESDIINRISSPDETFPVFSPPASATEADAPPLDVSERLPLPPGPIYTLMPPPEDGFVAAQQRRHQRQASLNIISLTTPQPDIGPLSPGRRRSSSTVFPTLEPESQAPPIPRPRTRHRRQSSVATSYAQEDLPRDRRQSSQVTSWYADNLDEDDETTISRGKTRWGKVGERSFRESLRSTSSKSPLSYHECNFFNFNFIQLFILECNLYIKVLSMYLSGDYYMFDKLEDEYKLEMPDDKDELDEEEKQTKEGKRLSRKMTLGQLMDKMKDESVRKAKEEELKLARRQSFPGLRKYREEGVEPAQTQQEQDRSAKSEPIPPQKFDADDEPGQDTEAGLTQSDDPQPSTSKSGTATAEETEMSKLLEEDKERKSRLHFSGLNLVLSFINSLLVSITIRLHRVSRNYRFVMRVLAKEKRNLKNKPGFGAGMRTGASMVWTPQGVSRASSRNLAVVATDSVVVSSNNNLNQNGTRNPLDSHNDDTNPPSGVTTPEHDHDPKFDVKERLQGVGAAMLKLASRDPHHAPIDREVSLVPEIRVLAPSLEQGLDDDFDSFKDDGSIGSKHESPVKKDDDDSDEEDFASKEHNIFVELIIAAWYAILSHTDFICYFFVFLNQINSASILSLPLPLLVLLWGTLTFPRPSKTFWITLIAYTQIVVLLKCISQFKSLWWNEQAITDNEPFAAARIIGIERTKGYATYDLILLLVVFCHRFILKSLGLWKSDFTDDSIAEGVYTAEVAVKDEKKKDEEDERLYIVKQDDIEVKLKKVDSEAQLGSRGSADVVIVTKTVEEPSSYCPGILKLTFQKYLSSTRAFYLQLIDRRSRKTADVYTLLFLCDFINFFVILGGFSAFGTAGGDQSVMSYFEENKVPITFLFMLLIQFFLIVIDRALYLRKYMVGKIVFQFFLIIGLHIWMFFLLPATTERRFNASNPPIIYYLIKCCHLLFSAYQIRCGYPTRILGNFITKGYSLLNNLGFKLFMNIPFLFELRTLMDWVWTDTSFSVFDWLKMEDIFANVYQLKCSRVFEDRMPVPRGQKRKPMIKYLMGGFMVGALIILIWFPLALFAFSSAVGEPNIPYDVSISLRIGPYEPVYTMSAQNSKIYELKDQNEWEHFLSPYNKDKSALTFLTSYEGADVAATELGSNSATIWNISPPDKDRLIEDINGTSIITVRFRYTISRITHSKEVPGVLSEEKQYDIKPEDTEIRQGLSKMLNQSDTNVSVVFPFLFPKFVKVKTSDMKTVHQLTTGAYFDNDDISFRNISIKLYQNSVNGSIQTWWAVNEVTDDKFYIQTISQLPYAKKDALVVYLFNDKIFPQTLSSVAAGGILSMYTLIILVVFLRLRSFTLGHINRIMFEDLPNVDRILQLCYDIYLVREVREYALEEDLFAKLIFIYRSPETLIKVTRLDEEEHQKTD